MERGPQTGKMVGRRFDSGSLIKAAIVLEQNASDTEEANCLSDRRLPVEQDPQTGKMVGCRFDFSEVKMIWQV